MNEYTINDNRNTTLYSQQKKRSRIFQEMGLRIIQGKNNQNNKNNNNISQNNNQNILQNIQNNNIHRNILQNILKNNQNNYHYRNFNKNILINRQNNNNHQNNNQNILQNNQNNNNHQNNNQNEIQNIELIWIDYEVNNIENTIYQNKLRNILSFKAFESINEGMEIIKKIKFKRIMILLSKRIFKEFITLFEREKKDIFCSLNILVFTNNKSEV